MRQTFLLIFSFLYLTSVSANEINKDFCPTILIVDKNTLSYEEAIIDLLDLQKSLIVCPSEIPESFIKSGFLLVPMTPDYIASLIEKKEGQIICIYDDHQMIGYIILTSATEFEELYQDSLTGKFETLLDLAKVHDWLSDPDVGYIEQIAVRTSYSRSGIGSHLIQMSKMLKPKGLISDVFVLPVKNSASLNFFFKQGFISPGVLNQYPGANANFPHDHQTQVFFWYGNDYVINPKFI